MHELSIAQSLLTTIESWRDHNGAPVVLAARVELGRLSGVDPEMLAYAWETACEACCPGLKNCRLLIDLLPLKYHCPACQHDFESEKLTSVCPECGAEYPVRSGGRE